MTGWRAWGPWPPPSRVTSGAPMQLGQARRRGVGCDRVVVAVDDQHRAAHRGAERLAAVPSAGDGPRCTVRISVSGVVSSPQPTASSRCLVECGSVNIWLKKNSRKPR